MANWNSVSPAPINPTQSITGMLDEFHDVLSNIRGLSYDARLRISGPWPEEAASSKDQGSDHVSRFQALLKMAHETSINLRVVLEVL